MSETVPSALAAPVPEAPAFTSQRRWRKLWLWLGGLVALGLMTVAFRAPLLRGAAHAWVINDPPAPADLIVALPQVSGRPVVEAARLFRAGTGSRILMVSSPLRPTDRLGLTTPFDQQNRQLMRAQGVPDSDFLLIGRDAADAHAAAQAVATWATTNRVRSVLVTTEQFQTRRIKWSLERALAPLGVEVRVRGVPVGDYSLDDWWRHEQGLIHFENEVVLHLFYRLNH